MKPDGTGLEVFASGVRNSVGFDWHPKTKELWFTENGRDELGDDLPARRAQPRAAAPACTSAFPTATRASSSTRSSATEAAAPSSSRRSQKLGAHVAALGMRFYTGKMFPAEYRNAVLVAEHGSWNRAQQDRLPRHGGQARRRPGASPTSRSISGWLDEQTDEAWGRPVDVEMLDDGSLLVSDDCKGVVYRVTYTSPEKPPAK